MTDPETTPRPRGWDYFDRIYCISLTSRPDRKLAAEREFAAVGLAAKVIFHLVAKNQADQVEGIYTSHMTCLRQGLAAGAKRILVFEDDILFRNFAPDRLDQACQALQARDDWQAFFLGCLTRGIAKTDHAALTTIRYRCLAHAYAINRPFAELLVRQEWCGLPFDELLGRIAKDCYAISPMCAFQGSAGSDNRTYVLNRLRKLCGGLAFIQKASEVFYTNRRLIVILHILAIVAAIAILRFFHPWP